MHTYVPVTSDIYWIGMNDRYTQLFEGLWPLPKGVCYNSYIIVDDEKIAVVDSVKEMGCENYLDKIRALVPEGRSVDYLIVNHMEPDHSGMIRALREVYPNLQIVGNAKTARFLNNFYKIEDGVLEIKDGDELKLGRHVLKFFITPMVHWPETMVTFDTTDQVLFSADAFGGFGALTGGIFDDEVDLDFFDDEILRYFSNIVGKYCSSVDKAIKKLAGVDFKVIAPTHGPIWRSNPGHIVDRYQRWSQHEAEEGITLVYGSMYGNSERLMESVAAGVASQKCSKVRIHNVSTTHVSHLIRDAWRFKGLVLGSPTYDMGLYPPMQFFIDLLTRKKLRSRTMGLFGTYAWSGGGVKTLTQFAQEGDWDLVDPIVEACACPEVENLENCFKLGKNIVKRVRMSLNG